MTTTLPAEPAAPPPAPAHPPLGSTAGSAYGTVIADQLVRERDRKTSLEQRAFNLVTASGAILTIFGAVVANALPKPAAPGQGQPTPPPLVGVEAQVFMLAVVLLIAAATLGLLANYWANTLGSFAELPTRDLKGWTSDNAWFSQDPAEAARRVAKVQVTRLEQARRYNTTKKYLFASGVLIEILGIAAIGFALAHHLTTS